MNKNKELIILTEEILKDIELGLKPLSKVVTKAIRLARLRPDAEAVKWLRLEMSGYNSGPSGVPPDEWVIGARSGRHYQNLDSKTKKIKTYMRYESIGRIETEIESAKVQLQVSIDPNVSIASSNPSQYVLSPIGNKWERSNLRTTIVKWTSVLDKIRTAIYNYVLQNYYQLKFGNISETIFDKYRDKVNQRLSQICPSAIKELVAVYDNLSSTNESDWSNAANSCRRLLKEIADSLYPADKKKKSGKHNLTENKYKNRLIEFIKNKSDSEKFNMVVGSQLAFITDRLDAINEYQAKGVHDKITRTEVERLVIYTYLITGDILSLITDKELKMNKNNNQKEELGKHRAKESD